MVKRQGGKVFQRIVPAKIPDSKIVIPPDLEIVRIP